MPNIASCILNPMSDSSLAAAAAANAAVLLIARTGGPDGSGSAWDRAVTAAVVRADVEVGTVPGWSRTRRRLPLPLQQPQPLQPPPRPPPDDGVDGGCVDGDGAGVPVRMRMRAESRRTAAMVPLQPPPVYDGTGGASRGPDAGRLGVAVAAPNRTVSQTPPSHPSMGGHRVENGHRRRPVPAARPPTGDGAADGDAPPARVHPPDASAVRSRTLLPGRMAAVAIAAVPPPACSRQAGRDVGKG
uniref:Uncharacterized protein n=1 Tax=Anopheles culicifacies TaxID=139723 RepID=A0A182LS50_9DIPT